MLGISMVKLKKKIQINFNKGKYHCRFVKNISQYLLWCTKYVQCYNDYIVDASKMLTLLQ